MMVFFFDVGMKRVFMLPQDEKDVFRKCSKMAHKMVCNTTKKRI